MADAEEEFIELQRGTDQAFTSLMDALVNDAETAEGEPETAPGGEEEAAGGGSAAGTAPAGVTAGPSTDRGAGAGAGTGADDGSTGPLPDETAATDTGGTGGAGEAAEAGHDEGDRGGTRPPVDVSALKLGELSSKFEQTTTQAFQQLALDGVQQEFKSYFDALNTHPRLLVGTEVPDLRGEDGATETLRSAEDAKDWQDAVKSLLIAEVRERATTSMEENRGVIDTVHAAIEIFTKNKDLVPYTKGFNKILADRFAAMAKPYELRVEGKLHGYTIPVQPLIDQLREQVKNEAAAGGPPVVPPSRRGPGRPRGSTKPRPTEQPQAGITSKAGSGAEEAEDFSTLFGTLGLPDLRI